MNFMKMSGAVILGRVVLALPMLYIIHSCITRSYIHPWGWVIYLSFIANSLMMLVLSFIKNKLGLWSLVLGIFGIALICFLALNSVLTHGNILRLAGMTIFISNFTLIVLFFRKSKYSLWMLVSCILGMMLVCVALNFIVFFHRGFGIPAFIIVFLILTAGNITLLANLFRRKKIYQTVLFGCILGVSSVCLFLLWYNNTQVMSDSAGIIGQMALPIFLAYLLLTNKKSLAYYNVRRK